MRAGDDKPGIVFQGPQAQLNYKYQPLVESLYIFWVIWKKKKKKTFFVTRVTYFKDVFMKQLLEIAKSIEKILNVL